MRGCAGGGGLSPEAVANSPLEMENAQTDVSRNSKKRNPFKAMTVR